MSRVGWGGDGGFVSSVSPVWGGDGGFVSSVSPMWGGDGGFVSSVSPHMFVQEYSLSEDLLFLLQSVTGTSHADDVNSYWTIKGLHGEKCTRG